VGDDVELWNWFQWLAEDVDADMLLVASGKDQVRPYVKVTDNSGQVVANATGTDISFETEVWDTNGWFSSGANTRITPNVEGLITFTATVFVPTRTGGYDFLGLGIRKNGSTLPSYVRDVFDNNNTDVRGIQVEARDVANGVGDYYTVALTQTNSGSASVTLPVSGTDVAVFEAIYERGMA
jgi:hypothetical protein